MSCLHVICNLGPTGDPAYSVGDIAGHRLDDLTRDEYLLFISEVKAGQYNASRLFDQAWERHDQKHRALTDAAVAAGLL